ncbi:MAG: transglycosylase SLT domain-containing protein [Pseudomonadota bacterium]|nr:transglycosylase SLT domain-containing protein [Pseudomonadota bacterium]
MKIAADPGLSVAASGQAPVMAALKRAGDATGADFELLFNMARRESSLNPAAEAKTSSAAGLFQFIDQTWLAAVKKYGAKHGLEAAAADITLGENGKYSVADPARKKEILDMRFDPAKAASLAGELVQENRVALERRLGRAIGKAEIYAAHFLGVGGAAKLLSASPDAKAADVVPQAAAANKPVFYGSKGAKTVAEVMDSIGKSMGADDGAAAEEFFASRPNADPRKVAMIREWRSAAELANAPAAAPRSSRTTGVADASTASPIEGTLVDSDKYKLLELLNAKSVQGALSPLAIAVLQSLDPKDLGVSDRNGGRGQA